MKAWLLIALGLAMLNSLALPSAVHAADQTLVRQTRVRTAGPTPHIFVVCYDDVRQKIPCADSARVALQLAYYGACDGCAPVALPPSRYGRYRQWWW